MNILKDLPWDQFTEVVKLQLESKRARAVVALVAQTLSFFGVPETHHPDASQILLYLSAIVTTLVTYYWWLGRSHQMKRRELEKKLKQAQAVVHDLEEKLESLEAFDLDERKEGQKEIRVWMDGAFDMMHYGHMNAFRLGRALGTKLIVGVNSDETITKCKGPPVMNDEERLGCVRGCKFVDEVVTGVPYVMNEEYIKFIIKEYKIDYIVHGDDPCIVDGKDVYEAAQKMGKYLTIPRTDGISTTDIVGRMLLMTRSHHSTGENEVPSGTPASEVPKNEEVRSHFLTTSRTIRLFGAGVKAPAKDAKIVYLAGSWDMFHYGHVNILEKARSLGDYVIVGVHRDAIINKHRGQNLPIMTQHERVLSVLGCKFVDDVLIDAPYDISEEMIDRLHISAVVCGSVRPQDELSGESDPYALPRQKGILKVIPSEGTLTVLDIVKRIFIQRDRFQMKFEKKKAAEDAYYSSKYSHSEASSVASQDDSHSEVEATQKDTAIANKRKAGSQVPKAPVAVTKATKTVEQPIESKPATRTRTAATKNKK